MNIFFQGSQGGGWLRGKISNIDIPPLCLWEGGEEGAFVDHNSAECFSSMFALSMVAAVTLHKEGRSVFSLANMYHDSNVCSYFWVHSPFKSGHLFHDPWCRATLSLGLMT